MIDNKIMIVSYRDFSEIIILVFFKIYFEMDVGVVYEIF